MSDVTLGPMPRAEQRPRSALAGTPAARLRLVRSGAEVLFLLSLCGCLQAEFPCDIAEEERERFIDSRASSYLLWVEADVVPNDIEQFASRCGQPANEIGVGRLYRTSDDALHAARISAAPDCADWEVFILAAEQPVDQIRYATRYDPSDTSQYEFATIDLVRDIFLYPSLDDSCRYEAKALTWLKVI